MASLHTMYRLGIYIILMKLNVVCSIVCHLFIMIACSKSVIVSTDIATDGCLLVMCIVVMVLLDIALLLKIL